MLNLKEGLKGILKRGSVPFSRLGLVKSLQDKTAASTNGEPKPEPKVTELRKGQLSRPSQFGPLTVGRKLGKGTFSQVFIAEDADGNQYALKTTLKGVLDNEHIREKVTKLAEREARIHLRAAKNPHIVTVVDFGTLDGHPYILEEYIKGINLYKAMQRGVEINPQQAVAFGIQVIEAMVDAHKKGIVHRDLKLDNVMLDFSNQTFRVIDFGSAYDPKEKRRPLEEGRGALAFMAPEQIGVFGDDFVPIPATDCYSICASIYMLTSGKKYHPGSTDGEIEGALISGEFDTDWGLIPEEYRDTLKKGLSRDPKDRFSNLKELKESLTEALGLKPKRVAAAFIKKSKEFLYAQLREQEGKKASQ